MLINPVKTKSMIITTRQKHLLSDLSLRLSLDGQNIENVTEHRLLGLVVDKKCRWQAQIEHNDNYYTIKASALRLFTETVTGWSEY